MRLMDWLDRHPGMELLLLWLLLLAVAAIIGTVVYYAQS